MPDEIKEGMATVLGAAVGAAAESAGEGGKVGEFETLVVDKQERRVTRRETLDAAQKWFAGDDRLKQNSDATKLMEDLKLVRESHDLDAFRRVAGHMGADQGQIEYVVQQVREAQAAKYAGAPTGETGGEPPVDTKVEGKNGEAELTLDRIVEAVMERVQGQVGGPVGVERLDPKLKEVILGLAETQVSGVVERALDADPVLGKILKVGDEKLRSAVRSLAFQEVKRRARSGSNVLAGQGVQDALQVVRAQLEALGVGGSGATPHTVGLGTAPGSSGGLHPSTEPMARPKGGQGDPAYGEWLTSRLNEELAKSLAD